MSVRWSTRSILGPTAARRANQRRPVGLTLHPSQGQVAEADRRDGVRDEEPSPAWITPRATLFAFASTGADTGGTAYVEGLLNNEQITDDTTRPPRARSTAV